MKSEVVGGQINASVKDQNKLLLLLLSAKSIFYDFLALPEDEVPAASRQAGKNKEVFLRDHLLVPAIEKLDTI